MALPVWGNLEKSQVDEETIEEAIARLTQAHEDDPNAHIEAGESLQSHKASAIIDHIVASIIADKIKNGEITNIKLEERTRAFTAIVDIGGDGDYTDIQSAIDYVNGLGGGSILVLPGTYESAVDITLYNNVSLYGLDRETCIVEFTAAGKRIKAYGDSADYVIGTIEVTHDSATVDGTNTNWEGNIAAGEYIMINWVWYKIAEVVSDTELTLENDFTGKAEAGMGYKVAALIGGIEIKHLTVRNPTHKDGFGVNFKYVKDSVIEDNVIENLQYGVLIETGCESIFITRNKIQNCSGGGADINLGSYIFFDFNDCANSGATAIAFHYAYYAQIVGNRIINSGLRGILEDDSHHCVIDRNFIYNVNGGDGIWLMTGSYIKVTNNYVENCDDNGIEVAADYCTIANNTVINNGDFGIYLDSWGANYDFNIVIANHVIGNSSGEIENTGEANTIIEHNIT